MCGIVGYIGNKQAYDILIHGLRRLEYRGYDSAGVAIEHETGELNVYKSKGKVTELESSVEGKDTGGTLGIAHTRWATHGEPNDVNAHPHISGDRTIALVHNGTIENYGVLKIALMQHGYHFSSETDTEVLVQLIAYVKHTNRCSLFDAVREALRQVEGGIRHRRSGKRKSGYACRRTEEQPACHRYRRRRDVRGIRRHSHRGIYG